MSVTATCGCVLTDEEGFGISIHIKGQCKDGSKSVDYVTLCNKCLKWYRAKGLELKTKKERDKWLTK